MPPKKINVGKCLGEQKGCKGFQDVYLSTIHSGEKSKRETKTPKPRAAGKLLAYTTPKRIDYVPNTPKRINNSSKLLPTPNQSKKESSLPKSQQQQQKFREETILNSPKTIKPPPKGLLFQTASATTILQGPKETVVGVLTKRDLQSSAFSQDPNNDRTKTQRILQWLRDCEIAQDLESEEHILIPTISNPAIVEPEPSKWLRTNEVKRNPGVENSKLAKGKAGQFSKIPQMGNIIDNKKYLNVGKSVEKRKRSNAELAVGVFEIDGHHHHHHHQQQQQQQQGMSSNKCVSRHVADVLDVSNVKKVKNWNPSLSPVLNSGNSKRQQKIKDKRQVGMNLIDGDDGEEKGKFVSKLPARRGSNFLLKSDVSWLRREKQLKSLVKETLCFEQRRMSRDKCRSNWWIPLKSSSMTQNLLTAADSKANRRKKSCQACAVTSSMSLDAGCQFKYRLKRKYFNYLLENLIASRVLEAKMDLYYDEKLKRRSFNKWRENIEKESSSNSSLMRKFQVAEDNYTWNLVWSSFFKWKEWTKRQRLKRQSWKKENGAQDRLREFIIMATSRIRKNSSPIPNKIEKNRSPSQSPFSDKTIANLSNKTQRSDNRKSIQSVKTSPCSSNKTLPAHLKSAKVSIRSETKFKPLSKREKNQKDEKLTDLNKNFNLNSNLRTTVRKDRLGDRTATAISRNNVTSISTSEKRRKNIEEERKKREKHKINEIEQKKKLDDMYKKRVNFGYSHVAVK